MIYRWILYLDALPYYFIYLLSTFLKLHLILWRVIFPSLFTVPIIPEFLYDIRHPDAPLSSYSKYPPVPPSTTPGNELEGGDYTTNGYGKLFIFLKKN